MDTDFDFYKNTYRGEAFDTEKDFIKHAREQEVFLKELKSDALLYEREDDGVRLATCAAAEASQKADMIAAGGDDVTSETIGSYSRTIDRTAANEQRKLDRESRETLILKAIAPYVRLVRGVK